MNKIELNNLYLDFNLMRIDTILEYLCECYL